jgi:hypothetical protein
MMTITIIKIKLNFMETFLELKNLILSLEKDANKFFEKDNSSAGTRLRKGMQEVKSLAQALRVNVSENKKNN